MQPIKFTNLDKVFWPEGITKKDLIEYYVNMAGFVLPYLAGRPLVMNRYPDGINGESFYQKECPEYAPEWITTFPVNHSDSGRTINYIVCNDQHTLAWLANQACIELHAWLSRAEQVEYPDLAIIDLDPADGATFADVLVVASLVKQALQELGLTGYPKTSGASGLHIFLPLLPRWTFRQVTAATGYLAQLIVQVYPQKATTEHVIKKRQGKVYLDYLQNTRGRTMAFPYCLRPLPGAPVSAPVTWEEIQRQSIQPGDFNMFTIVQRVKQHGDLYQGLFANPNNLEPLLELAMEKV